jgi:hypothetical protein
LRELAAELPLALPTGIVSCHIVVSAEFYVSCPSPPSLGIFSILAFILVSSICSAKVVINEIHFDPDIKTELVEFVELTIPTFPP